MSNFMHGFMSMESTAEAYNEAFRSTLSVKLFKEFLDKNRRVGNHFMTKIREVNHSEDLDIPHNDFFNQERIEASGHQVQNRMYELHRKSVVNAYYNHWVKQEIKERKMNYIFGPYHTEDGKVFTFRDSVEAFLVEIDDLRSKETYAHDICAGKSTFPPPSPMANFIHPLYNFSDACRARGCGNVWSTDGLWKLAYPIWFVLFELKIQAKQHKLLAV
jgi:hypothetical protein